MKKTIFFPIILCSFLGIAQAQIANQAITVEGTGVYCSGGNAYISTSSSEIGIAYYLRDNSNDSVVVGPIYGTGNKLLFNLRNINSTKTYNVYAAQSQLAGKLHTTDDLYSFGSSSRNINTQATISAWVKTSLNTACKLIDKHSGFSGFTLSMNTAGKVNFLTNNTNSGLSTTSINDGQWHYITGVFNGSLCKLYIDGVLEQSVATGNSTLSNTSQLYVGSVFSSSAFVGSIDEFSILNTAANDSTIQAIMNNCLTGNELDLVAYFKFNNFGSQTIQDHSLMGINGGFAYSQLLSLSDYYEISPKGCISYTPIEMNQLATVIVSNLTNETVSILEDSVCMGSSTSVNIGSSVVGASYFLKDQNNTTVNGPVIGTGNTMNFNTGAIDSAKTFNVYSEVPSSLGNGMAFNFNGTSSAVGTNYKAPAGASAFTFEAWVNVTPINGDPMSIFQVNNSDPNFTFGEYALATSGASYDGLTLYIENSFTLTAPNVLVFNTWQHIAVTFNSGIARIFVNGVQVALGSASVSNIGGSGYQLVLGTGNFWLGYFAGKMDNVRLWNVARTGPELSSNMNNCDLGNITNLLHFFPFRETSITAPLDWVTGKTSIFNNGFNSTNWVPSGITCAAQCQLPMTQTVDVNTKAVDNSVTLSGTTLTASQSNATYQWLDCNNNNSPISGETSASFTPTTNGNYAVEITLNNCVDTSTCQNVTGVGINTIASIHANVYPNPTKDVLNIVSTEAIEQAILYHSNGALIRTATNNPTKINVSDLPQGMYILVLKSDKGVAQYPFTKE